MLSVIFDDWHGKADLVGAFFRRASMLVANTGLFGFIATSSIIRGETADAALRPLINHGFSIFAARTPFPWPGKAAGDVVMICYSASPIKIKTLNCKSVDYISIRLDEYETDAFDPYVLHTNEVYGGALGVKLSPRNIEFLWSKPPKMLSDIPSLLKAVRRTLGGREIYGKTDPENYSFAIDSDSDAFVKLENSPELMGVVHPLRHTRPALALKEATKRNRLLFVCGETSTHLVFHLTNKNLMIKHKAVGFCANSFALLSVLQSECHVIWSWEFGLRRVSGLVYSPKRCFHTFPLPKDLSTKTELALLGKMLIRMRREALDSYSGLTNLYNAFNSPSNTDALVAQLRRVHVEIDKAVVNSYGWQDLALNHGFHETKQGIRYTISEEARREVLDRLLELNHQRHAEEVAAGLHEKKTGKPAALRKPKPAPTGSLPQVDMFGHAQADVFETADSEPHAVNPDTSLQDYLQAHPGWHNKDALLTATGFPAHRWNAEIKRLLDSGQVEREGEKRGARYRFREA